MTYQTPLLLIIIFLSSSPIAEIKGQQCGVIIKDSIIAGSGAGGFTDYINDHLGRMAQSYHTDSGSISGPGVAVIALFDGGSQLPVEYRFVNTNGTTVPIQTIQYDRDGSGRIISISNSTGSGTITHNVSYDANGSMQSIILANSTGSPPGFPGSFKDMTWQNGNVVSLKLFVGSDSLMLSATLDTKNNIFRKLPNTFGAEGLLEAASNNNILQLVTTVAGTITGNAIPAGTAVIDRRYAYNAYNDVETMQELPALFNMTTRTRKYFYSYAYQALPVPSYTYTVNNLTVSFTGQSTNYPSIWQWTFGDSSTSALQNPFHSYPGAGSYPVCLTASNFCGDSTVCQSITMQPALTSIQGGIRTQNGQPIRTVTLNLSGQTAQTVSTSADGNYFFNITQAGNYTVTPSKNNDIVTNNGITTADILLIRRHILGIQALPDPYKIIAADVNGSNSISTQDILLMRAVILGNNSTFPNGRLWSFVPANHIFTDPQSPFPFPSAKTYTNLQQSLTSEDFIGIKLGDVNDNWDPSVP